MSTCRGGSCTSELSAGLFLSCKLVPSTSRQAVVGAGGPPTEPPTLNTSASTLLPAASLLLFVRYSLSHIHHVSFSSF